MMILARKLEENVWVVLCKFTRKILLVYILRSLSLRISGHYSRKAVARDWYSNGGDIKMKSKLEIFQQSEYDITNIEVDFKGLVNTSGYHIHMVYLLVISMFQFLPNEFLDTGGGEPSLSL